MKHVAPHRWADAFAGKLDDAERAEIEAHAARCRACARARDRIKLASGSFPALRAIQPPEIAWDHVRARVHWSVSTQRRGKLPRPARWTWLAVAVGAAAAVAAIATGAFESASTPPAPAITDSVPPARVTPSKPAALVGLVSRTSGDVLVQPVVPSPDPFERVLGVGDRITTADSRVDVQFGDASALSLGPHSTLELRQFDVSTIELALTAGSVDIEVTTRVDDQRFIVRAGDRTIKVVGTQFRVVYDPDKQTEVACKHGIVDVEDAIGGKTDVHGGTKLVVHGHDAITKAAVAALTADELAAMVPPITMPVWNPDLARSSAPLEVATSGRRDVRVDGIEIGLAPVRIRVMAGRHTVEAADRAGRFRPAGWIDVGATPARLEVPAEAPSTANIVLRKHQLLAGIDRIRLASCTRRIAKQGLSSTYVQFAISVDGSGAVGFLNITASDLGSSGQDCVKAVLRDVRFTSGPSATWTDRVDL